jgi:hypothetical protein
MSREAACATSALRQNCALFPAGIRYNLFNAGIRDFLKLPIPKIVWEKIRPFQDEDFVEFVETTLGNNCYTKLNG